MKMNIEYFVGKTYENLMGVFGALFICTMIMNFFPATAESFTDLIKDFVIITVIAVELVTLICSLIPAEEDEEE